MYEIYRPNREDEYTTALTEKCRRWEAKHPDESVALRSVVLAALGWPAMPPVEPTNLRRMIFEEAVREHLRSQQNWPSMRAWLAEQRA